MSYRPLGQFPQYLLPDGRVNDGGWLHFYETDLTTPKTTYSDPGLTVANPNPLQLTAEGYPENDVWGDGAFGVTLSDPGNVVYRTYNNIQPDTPANSTIPALVNGAFLTNDGSNLLWQQIAQLLLPDPTGLNNYFPLVVDGVWTATPFDVDVPDPEIVVSQTNKSFRAGVSTDTTKFLIQVGTDTAPAAPGNTATTKTVTYPEAFTVCWGAFAFPTTNSQPGGPIVPYGTSAAGITTASFGFDVAEGNSSGSGVVNAVPFVWIAIGTKTVT